MDAGLLDVLHDAAEEEVRTVVQRVDVDLDRVVDEAVDQHRPVGADLGRGLDVGLQGGVVVEICMPRPPRTYDGRTRTG